MKAVVSALLVMLAIAAVFETTEAAFCRVSSYKVDPKLAKTNKEAMFKNCAPILKKGTPVIVNMSTKSGCVLLTQKVASPEAWDDYSNCEKSKSGIDNSKFYGPLKKYADPCEQFTAKKDC